VHDSCVCARASRAGLDKHTSTAGRLQTVGRSLLLRWRSVQNGRCKHHIAECVFLLRLKLCLYPGLWEWSHAPEPWCCCCSDVAVQVHGMTICGRTLRGKHAANSCFWSMFVPQHHTAAASLGGCFCFGCSTPRAILGVCITVHVLFCWPPAIQVSGPFNKPEGSYAAWRI
jgi:hypothetical protein